MRIDSVNNNMNNANGVRMGMQTQMTQGMDSYSKNIQNQIQTKQQELQKLSENEDMSLEDKMKKRQEIQQEISDLNMQLRQHQIEQRREQQQSKGQSCDDMLGGKQKAQKKSQNGHECNSPKVSLLSQASMTALISADSSIKQAKVQGSVATQMEGRANVLKAEIKQSGSTEAKEAELADLEQKAANATASQMNTLAEANKTVSEAATVEHTEKKDSDANQAQAESKTEKAADSGTKGEKAQDGISGADAQAGTAGNVQQDNGAQAQDIQPAETVSSETPAAQTAVYSHVDVRL